MRKILALAVCLVLLSSAVAKAEMNIAFFDLGKVAEQSNVLKEALAAMRKKHDPTKNALETERKNIEKKIQAAGQTPTQAQISEVRTMERAYAEKASTFARTVQADDLRIRQDFDTVAVKAAAQLAKKKGYDAILDSKAALYFDPARDVTADMLSEVNSVWRSMKK